MNGIHDMGGMHGFGAVRPDPDESPFHARWEGRVFALTLLMSGHLGSNVDRSRFLLEQLPPLEYLRLSYFERWLERLVDACRQSGFVTEAELDAQGEGRASTIAKEEHGAIPAPVMRRLLQHATPGETAPATKCRFAVGDRVRARTRNPEGHTRLPRYARGRCGVVIACHGSQTFPDSNARLEGPDPRPLYGVCFPARELWGEDASPNDSVCLDLWEPYLEPA